MRKAPDRAVTASALCRPTAQPILPPAGRGATYGEDESLPRDGASSASRTGPHCRPHPALTARLKPTGPSPPPRVSTSRTLPLSHDVKLAHVPYVHDEAGPCGRLEEPNVRSGVWSLDQPEV